MGVGIVLYLLGRDVQTVRWNGRPLHEATKAEISEIQNGDYILKVDYPITDTEIYKLFREDMLIIAPTPLTGRQLFRIKDILEQDDTITLTCPHITEDVWKRYIKPISVANTSAQTALNAMIAGSKTDLGQFTFDSDILDKRTFNTTEDETLYKVLMDGKHSIVGTWEGELVRDNFLISLNRHRGQDRGVVITTHQNLKKYERNRSSSSVVTRLHLTSTFKPEGAENDTVIKATVDSPLINQYPYINEAEYTNSDLKTEAELRKWGEAKFANGNIDKVSDKLKIEAHELDGQVVHMGDIVSIMSFKHDINLTKKAVGYTYDALKEVYLDFTFDDKASVGGSSLSSGVSVVADEILRVVRKNEDDEYYLKLQEQIDNANRAFDTKEASLRQELTDGIEQSKAEAERFKAEVSSNIEQRINQSRDVLTKQLKDNFDGELKGIKDNIRDQIVGINERFDNFKIGRRNLLQGTRLLSKYNPFDVFNGYKIARSVAGLTGYRDTYSDTMTVAATSKEYIAVFYARASHNDYPIRCHMYNPNTGTTVETSTGYIASNNADGVALLKITKEWKSYWVKWGQNPTDKPKNIIIGRHGVQMGGIDGAWVEICAPALFEGNVVGTHEDAPEDVPNRNYVLDSGNTTIATQLSLSSDLIEDVNQAKTFTMSVEIEGANIGPNPANNRKRYGFATIVTFTDDSMWYPEVWETVDSPRRRVARTWTVPTGKTIKNIKAVLINDTNKTNIVIAKPKIELGRYMTPWEESPITFMDGKLAEYKRTIEGEFTKITEAMNGTVKKADVQITPNYISFGVGKQVDGKTISSLFVQQPDSINAIAKLFKVTGDMIVDGSITGKDLATNSITTGHLTTGSVTAKALAADSVTGDKLAVDSAMIKKLTTDNAFIRELTSKNAFITQIQSIDITANHIKGGRMTATNNAMMIDFETGQYNVYSNEAAFRRIDDTSSSQFIKMVQGGFIGEYIRDSKAALITVGTNHDKTENTENSSFAGTRLWSGKANKVNESFYEIVSDRIAIYANGEKRSPWLFHNNTKDGKTFLLPMNEKGIRHYLGRGDKFFTGVYANDFYLSGGRSVGAYLWDLLTCFSQIKAAGWTFSDHSKRHIQSILSKYGG